jgi:hypothetical protein
MANWKASSAPFISIIAVLLVVFAVTGATTWESKCATFDEPLHMVGAWLQTYHGDFRCDPEDPPLWRYYVALGAPSGELELSTSGAIYDAMLKDRAYEGQYVKNNFYYTAANDSDSVLGRARERMIVLAVLLGGVIAWWSWRLGGAVAAVAAAAGFCFDPNFLAHGPLVKDDVPMSLALLAFMAAMWMVGKRVTPIRVAAVAILLGVALTVKFSGILAVPILGICLLLRALLPEAWPTLKSTAATRGKRLRIAVGIFGAACVFAYGFVWACYRFRYAPGADPNQLLDFSELLRIGARHAAFGAYNAFDLSDAQLQSFTSQWKPDVFFRGVLWIGEHRLLPQAWVYGLLFTYDTAPGRAAFLLGTSAMRGRWEYFPVAMLVKTPVATLGALCLAAIYWLANLRRIRRAWDIFVLAILPVFYLAVAMRSDLNLGIRHVLPVYPAMFIFLGVTAAHAMRRFRKATLLLAGVFVVGLAVECYAAYPDFIPFFNVAAGGWENGPNLLGDSNVDWGQDLPALAQWQREHPQYQIFLDYFGSADPRYYEIHYVKLPGSLAPADESPSPSRVRVYALSATAAQNPWIGDSDRKFYLELRGERPLAVLGHCIYLYNQP